MLNAGWMKIHRWYVPTSWCAWCSLAKRCARHSQLLTETVMTPPMMVTECENVNDPVRRGCGETWFCRWLFSSQHRDISAKHRLMTIINTINPANSLRIDRTCFSAENLFAVYRMLMNCVWVRIQRLWANTILHVFQFWNLLFRICNQSKWTISR